MTPVDSRNITVRKIPTQIPNPTITYSLGADASHGFGSHGHVGVSEQRDGVSDIRRQRRPMRVTATLTLTLTLVMMVSFRYYPSPHSALLHRR